MNGTQNRTEAGLTLLELLLVMFLLALILGGGVGFFSALDLGRRAAGGVVRNVIRSAQNTAVASHAPARVVLDKQAGTIQAESLITLGTWRFENQSIEGSGPSGRAEPELFDEDGYLGACFHPAGQLRAVAEIPLQQDPGFDFTLGFSIECAIRRDSESGGRVYSMGPADTPTLALDVGKNGALRARFRTRVGDASSDRAGGSVIASSDPGLVPVGRWVKVRVRYDRARFELLLDGTLVRSEEAQDYVWKVDAPLVLSDSSLPFPGSIDDLVIAVLVAGEPGRLGDTVQFAKDAPATIQFAASGGLDRSVHADAPRIGLEFLDGTRETVLVGLYGTVE